MWIGRLFIWILAVNVLLAGIVLIVGGIATTMSLLYRYTDRGDHIAPSPSFMDLINDLLLPILLFGLGLLLLRFGRRWNASAWRRLKSSFKD